jgi:hypothetical protein
MAEVSEVGSNVAAFPAGLENGASGGTREALDRLAQAGSMWVETGRSGGLSAWLVRELDSEGCPKRLAIADLWPALLIVARARRLRPKGWPEAIDEQICVFFRTALRFSRPDGSTVFGPEEPPDLGEIRRLAKSLPDRRLRTVLDTWFSPTSRPRGGHAPPPLPAYSNEDRPLAVLRADWSIRGDFLTIDHRQRTDSCLLELFGGGRRWLGPEWSTAEVGRAIRSARPVHWRSGSNADCAEWAFRAGAEQIVRTAVFLRGRSLALLADHVTGPGANPDMRLDIAPGVAPRPVPESRSLQLKLARGTGSCQLIPLGLPAVPYASERGSFTSDGSAFVLRHRAEGRHTWLPLLISWDPVRNRKTLNWRVLTVVEKSKVCRPGVAFAARVSWGRGEGLIIYRSLGKPAMRSFLGYQTEARFLVGLFSADGEVDPLLTIE